MGPVEISPWSLAVMSVTGALARQLSLLVLLSAHSSSTSAVVLGVRAHTLRVANPASSPQMSRNLPGALTMVAAKEVYSLYVESATPVKKALEGTAAPVATGAMAGVVVAAAAAGYVLTPSSKIAVNAIGGAISGSVGLLARARLEEQRKDAAKLAVAVLLAKGVDSVSDGSIAAAGDRHSVDKKRFQQQKAELFLLYLNSVLRTPNIETSELSELKRLITVLRLSPAQVGMQVYAAGRTVYSTNRAYIEDSEDSDGKRILTKFIFLAERLISADESEEGYKYEAQRLQKIFALPEREWAVRAEEAAAPFYRKTLDSAVLQGAAVTSAQLSTVREALGVSEATAQALHDEVFARYARLMLKPELGADAKLADADHQKLRAMAELLSMDEESPSLCLLAMTTPLYFDAVKAALAEMSNAVDDHSVSIATGKLALREQQLVMPPSAARDLERRAIREKAASMLEAAATLMRAQNVDKATQALKELLAYCESLVSFVATASRVRGDAVEEAASLFSSLAPKSLKGSEVLSMYRVLLLSCLKDLKVDEAEAALLEQLRVVLGLSDEDCTRVYEAAAGPLFRKLVQQVVGQELGAEQKASLQTKINDLALPPAVITSISVDVYGKKLEEVAGGNKITNAEDSALLAELRNFLGLAMEQVHGVHALVCSDTYRASVREVMGVTGRIPDEYWEGLAKLQERLGLSDETAQQLFAETARAKMRAFGQAAMEQLEEKLSGGQGGKDKGDDPLISKGGSMAGLGIEAGAGSLATEVLNLVDFALAARVLVQKEVEVEVDEKMVRKEVDVIETSLKGEFSSKALKELYRQYLIEAFSGQQAAQNSRLFNNLSRLSLVLGLEESEVAAIHLELGTLIYRRYLARAFSQTGSLGEREHSFLNSIKSALAMEQAKCDQLVREAETNYVSDQLAAMFDRSQVNAEKSREVRDAADRLEVSLRADLEVATSRLEKMFQVELEDLIETGELTPVDTGALEEICEALHVSEERAADMLQLSITRRCTDGVLQVVALLRQGAERAMLEELTTMLKFAAIAPFEVVLSSIEMEEKNEVYMLYQANALTDGAPDEETKAKLELLKTVIGLTEVAPSL
uniref:Uncharacterized protein n=1 Tax=Calcidiscus leptoporus TaxID=127549 RepID=A0A7S0J369_9EUKA